MLVIYVAVDNYKYLLGGAVTRRVLWRLGGQKQDTPYPKLDGAVHSMAC